MNDNEMPIGFDETPPDMEMFPTSASGTSFFSCLDGIPRTVAESAVRKRGAGRAVRGA